MLNYLVVILIVIIFTSVLHDAIGYHRYMSRIKVGTKLRYTVVDMFDESSHTFNVQVEQIYQESVRLRFSDGSIGHVQKMTMYAERWEIVDDS